MRWRSKKARRVTDIGVHYSRRNIVITEGLANVLVDSKLEKKHDDNQKTKSRQIQYKIG